jgi:hypothetical protein
MTGFEMFDSQQAGVYGNRAWKHLAKEKGNQTKD